VSFYAIRKLKYHNIPMIFLPVFILAIIQGITEFLPISSSGHLILVHNFTADGLSSLNQKRLDIGVHLGTLAAVIVYFYKDLFSLFNGCLDILRGHVRTDNAHKARLITVASVPIIICGGIVFRIDLTMLDSVYLMAWMTIIFGIILYIADNRYESPSTIQNFTIKNALVYGVFQIFALIPGVSRSGVTMTAGRFMGHSRVEAARFSLLMGMVTIGAAGTITGLSVVNDEAVTKDLFIMLGVGMILSFMTAYFAIFCMMRWFSMSGNMTPFVIYRIILGIGLLVGLHYDIF